MSERLVLDGGQKRVLNPKEAKGDILNLKVGQVFSPFKDINPTAILQSPTEKVQIPFVFNNVSGKILLHQDQSFFLPLEVIGVPLLMSSVFSPKSLKDFDEMQKHVMEFMLGKRKLYLSCSGSDAHDVIDIREELERGIVLGDGDQEIVNDKWYIDQSLQALSHKRFLLPWNARKLSNVTGKIVELS